MAKPIIITKDNKDSIFQIKKIERKKLYGYRKRLAIDENNEECKRASLTEDGQILIKSGMTSQGWYIDGGKQIEANEIGAIDENNNELSLIGLQKISNSNVIDTLELARNKFPGSGISLDALCKRFRIDNSKREKHTALIDCDLLSKVYINLIDQREPTLNLVDNNEVKETTNEGKLDYYKKIILPTKEELSNHNEFLKKNLKKNYF